MTYPLQVIKEPIAPASRQLKPMVAAAAEHPQNFERKEVTQRTKVYTHADGVFNDARSVFKPESMKYCYEKVSVRREPWILAGLAYDVHKQDVGDVFKLFRHGNSVAILARDDEPNNKRTLMDQQSAPVNIHQSK